LESWWFSKVVAVNPFTRVDPLNGSYNVPKERLGSLNIDKILSQLGVFFFLAVRAGKP